MYYVIIVSPFEGEPFAHPVIPRTTEDASTIATELSRDFAFATVSMRCLATNVVRFFQNGRMLSA